MAFWARIDADYVDRFRAWHNCEHIPERVSVPGFRVGWRYFSLADPSVFLMMYDTDSPAVLASEPYLRRLDDPTPWTRASLQHFRESVRGIYAAIGDTGPALTLNQAPYLVAVRFDVDAPDPDRVVTERLDALRGSMDDARARLFGSDSAAAGIATSERGIHGGGPGEERYLLLLETANPEPLEAVAGVDWLAPEVVGLRDAYAIDYSLYAAR